MSEIDIRPIIAAAKHGGAILTRYFGTVLEVTQKSIAADMVTKADTESEQAIVRHLAQHFPKFAIKSEESGHNGVDSDYTFIIDPLDGTGNFLMNLPLFTVSIALLHRGRIVAGVIYDPITKDVYHALRGRGAYSNDVHIQVNAITDPARTTIAYGSGYHISRQSIIEVAQGVYGFGAKRMLHDWSAARDLCLLASGKIEGIIINTTQDYDFMAGKLIAKEAGAIITDFTGQSDTDANALFVAANTPKIHRTLVDISRKLLLLIDTPKHRDEKTVF